MSLPRQSLSGTMINWLTAVVAAFVVMAAVVVVAVVDFLALIIKWLTADFWFYLLRPVPMPSFYNLRLYYP